jgi:hypothetical protein
MGDWASAYIEKLKNGEVVQFQAPNDDSMKSRIESGQLVTIEPIKSARLRVDDIVLCTIGKCQYLRLVKDITTDRFGPTRYQIGSAAGKINGWIMIDQVFGKMT